MRASLLFLTLCLTALVSADQLPDRQETLKGAFSYILGRSGEKGIFASDATIECAQGCIDEDWCPCTKVTYTPEEYRTMMASSLNRKTLHNLEMKVFVPKHTPNAYVRSSCGESGDSEHAFFSIFTFDDAGKISQVKNVQPHLLTSEESEMLKKSRDAFKRGDISSLMKIYEPDMKFYCDKACVDADWCSCKKKNYNYNEIEKWAESISKNLAQFKDLTVNGEPMTSRMEDPDGIKKLELYFVDNNMYILYDIAGMFKGTKVPNTPMLEMFSLSENKKIEQGSLITGMVVKPARKAQ